MINCAEADIAYEEPSQKRYTNGRARKLANNDNKYKISIEAQDVEK